MSSLWKKILGLLLRVVVFAVLFFNVYLWLIRMDYGYSKLSSAISGVHLLGISLAPKPNDSNVALDTFIRIGTMRQTTVKDLQLTPEVPIA